LRQEGWIHHLGRHTVVCFLTQGRCYVHWERSAEVFEEWLVDHETASNVGHWMWGCVINGDESVQEEGGMRVYPKPMLGFNERRQVCIDKLKKAYAIGMYGDDGEGKGWKAEGDFWV
jgi:hypothetical protein